MIDNNKDIKKETAIELNLVDLFPLLIKFKYLTFLCLIIPILISTFYILNREENFVAEIIIKESSILMPPIMTTPTEFQSPSLAYIKGFDKSNENLSNIDGKRLYHSYMDLLQEINSDDIKDLKIEDTFGSNLIAAHIIIEEEKKLTKSFVTMKYPNEDSIRDVVRKILSKVDSENKKIILDDLNAKKDYINVLKNDARERHAEQILFTEERIKSKIDYLIELQNRKLEKTIITIDENLELARLSGIFEPIIPEIQSFSRKASNNYLQWSREPDRSLETSRDMTVGDRKETQMPIPSLSGGEYSNIIDSGIPLFYFGVNILEKESETIKSRKDTNLLTPGLVELEAELLNIGGQKGDAFIVYLEYLNDLHKNISSQAVLMNEIVDNKRIKTVNYNLDKIKVDKGSFSASIIIIISIIFGLVLASAIAVIRESSNRIRG